MSPIILCFLPPLARTRPPKSWLSVCSNFRLPSAGACTLSPSARCSSDRLERPYLPLGRCCAGLRCHAGTFYPSRPPHDSLPPALGIQLLLVPLLSGPFSTMLLSVSLRWCHSTHMSCSGYALSTVAIHLAVALHFQPEFGQLIKGLPSVLLDLDHECARSFLHSFSYAFNNRYHDICICVSSERCTRATSYPSRYLVDSTVESGFTVAQVDQVTLGWGCL